MLDPPRLEEAAELFERMGTEYLASALLKFSAKNQFFDGVICTLASGDIVTAESRLAKYKEMDYSFGGCREAKLLDDIVQAFKDMNAGAFTDAVYNYDQISKLEPWRTKILLKIKKQMTGMDGGSGAGAGGAAAAGAGDGHIDIT